MYALESSLNGQPIISLQTGQLVAEAGQPILDIATLEVIAFTCHKPHQREQFLLLSSDIRQFAADCIIIDDEDQLADPSDIVRLDNLKNPYSPLKKTVVADTGRKLGIVEDYSINLETSRVQKLYVRANFWLAWLASNLTIDRTQIIDISPDRITVRDATVAESALSPDSVPEIHP